MGGDARAHQARVELGGGRSTCPSQERWGSYREGSAMRRLRGRPSRESPSRRPPEGPTPLGQLWVLLWLLPLTPSPSFLCYYSLSCLVGFRETHKHARAPLRLWASQQRPKERRRRWWWGVNVTGRPSASMHSYSTPSQAAGSRRNRIAKRSGRWLRAPPA